MKQQRYKQDKRQLLNKMETRFKTIMIGSLSRIEDHLGFLWGDGNDEKLTEKQQNFLDIWESLRNEILNHGNYHLREGLDDIEDFFDTAEKYTYKFILSNRRENNE